MKVYLIFVTPDSIQCTLRYDTPIKGHDGFGWPGLLLVSHFESAILLASISNQH